MFKYLSVMKEHPWVEHLTSVVKKHVIKGTHIYMYSDCQQLDQHNIQWSHQPHIMIVCNTLNDTWYHDIGVRRERIKYIHLKATL